MEMRSGSGTATAPVAERASGRATQPPLVVKFGGTSLATAAHVRRAGRRVRWLRRRGGPVVVVVSALGRTTDRLIRRIEAVTLGRGGSDTTAVFLAMALGAECHVVTDVDGVYDADPRRFPQARPLPEMSHAMLLRLAEAGARVVHAEAARIAERAGVALHVYHHAAPPRRLAGTRVGGGKS